VQAFDGIYIITAGGPATDTTNLPYYIYQIGFQGFDIGRASAMAVVVVATILIATFAGMRSREELSCVLLSCCPGVRFAPEVADPGVLDG
jgi:ABC-type sugar transport system permease subunit